MDDSYKLINEITSALKKELRSKSNARYESVLKLAVVGGVMVLRSAVIPVFWDNRSNMMKALKLLICLYVSTLSCKLSSELNHISI